MDEKTKKRRLRQVEGFLGDALEIVKAQQKAERLAENMTFSGPFHRSSVEDWRRCNEEGARHFLLLAEELDDIIRIEIDLYRRRAARKRKQQEAK